MLKIIPLLLALFALAGCSAPAQAGSPESGYKQVTMEEAITLIEKHRQQEAKRHLKQFEEDSEMEIMNGRYGAYISYKGTNYKLPSAMARRAVELTYEDCMQVVENAQNEATETAEKGTAKKRNYARKK